MTRVAAGAKVAAVARHLTDTPMSNLLQPSVASANSQPKAVLVGVELESTEYFDPTLDELAQLAQALGDSAVARLVVRRKAPDAAFFIGSGKADEVKSLVKEHEAQVVLFDQAISPAQQRNLERLLEVPVADRTMLILEIFAARAKSHEGKLQVELAQLQYLSTRLVRRWTRLERQRGGAGHRGGPGEAQIELDRRMIGERIKALKQQLQKVQRQRDTQRRARQRSQTVRISLVGYTNAGKSTLFNVLTKSSSYTADQLFATLDTTTRELRLEGVAHSATLSDTVGFIHGLPHRLVRAFKATLQEAADADLLLHVIDASSPSMHEQMQDVDSILAEIGAATIPRILVFNKCDCIADIRQPLEETDLLQVEGGVLATRVWVSAKTGDGMNALRQAIVEAVTRANGISKSMDLDVASRGRQFAEQSSGYSEDVPDRFQVRNV